MSATTRAKIRLSRLWTLTAIVTKYGSGLRIVSSSILTTARPSDEHSKRGPQISAGGINHPDTTRRMPEKVCRYRCRICTSNAESLRRFHHFDIEDSTQSPLDRRGVGCLYCDAVGSVIADDTCRILQGQYASPVEDEHAIRTLRLPTAGGSVQHGHTVRSTPTVEEAPEPLRRWLRHRPEHIIEKQHWRLGGNREHKLQHDPLYRCRVPFRHLAEVLQAHDLEGCFRTSFPPRLWRAICGKTLSQALKYGETARGSEQLPNEERAHCTYVTSFGTQIASYEVEQDRLAGPRRSECRHPLPLLHAEREVLEPAPGSESERCTADFYRRFPICAGRLVGGVLVVTGQALLPSLDYQLGRRDVNSPELTGS